MYKLLLSLTTLILIFTTTAQEIPKVYTNIGKDEKGMYVFLSGRRIYAEKPDDAFQFINFHGNPKGHESGIDLDFKFPKLYGILYYGFINYGDAKMPQTIYFRNETKIIGGKTTIDIKGNLSGRYDMIGWEQSGKGILGYRIVNSVGKILYDGKLAFTKSELKFKAEPTLIEGPFINKLGSNSVVISFITTQNLKASVKVNGKSYKDKNSGLQHEIKIDGLKPNTIYEYSIQIKKFKFSYSFETAPIPGSRNKFTFAYASDSRAGKGGGERDLFGTNAYIMKRIASQTKSEGAKFIQFTGDLINGYETSKERIKLQYANWKHAVEPFWHHIPFIAGFGNHESYLYRFHDYYNNRFYEIDHFPFKDNSAESVFQDNFVNPENGPLSEDGSEYDPDPDKQDFPSYKETVFWYAYDNVAMIVLNSNYWYTPINLSKTSGNPHAFVMDNQLKWFDETIRKLEGNKDIDHIFVTIHTPFFPNGGHVADDMWYNGNNIPRAYVNGRAYKKGIIQRRDELLDIIVNKSKKTLAILTGDEHNYNLLTITDKVNRYPSQYKQEKLKLSRKIYQINNGAAGAPYYAKEITPWMKHLRNFSTQNALVLFDVDGLKVFVRVINPDTEELIDEYFLKE